MAPTVVTPITPTSVLTKPSWTNVVAGSGNGARIPGHNGKQLILMRNPHATDPTGNISLTPSGTPPAGTTYAAVNITLAAGEVAYVKDINTIIFNEADGDLIIAVAGTQNVDMMVINY
jgi:hypothetical protein